jgi:antibiotic biosynthesis monooxygenase (ABM) superfamily enzyme
VTFVVVFPTVELLTRVAAPRLAFMPAVLRDVVVVAGMCVVLSYAIPAVTLSLRRWLDP